jgi:hypothetical protein
MRYRREMHIGRGGIADTCVEFETAAEYLWSVVDRNVRDRPVTTL